MEEEKFGTFFRVTVEYPGIELENDHEVDRGTCTQEEEESFSNPHTQAHATASNADLDDMGQKGDIPLDRRADNPIELLEDYYGEKGDTQEEYLEDDLKPKIESDAKKEQQKYGLSEEEKTAIEEINMVGKQKWRRSKRIRNPNSYYLKRIISYMQTWKLRILQECPETG